MTETVQRVVARLVEADWAEGPPHISEDEVGLLTEALREGEVLNLPPELAVGLFEQEGIRTAHADSIVLAALSRAKCNNGQEVRRGHPLFPLFKEALRILCSPT